MKPTITRDEYKQFLKLLKENDCTAMGDWLRIYNVADVASFIEAFRKMAGQYYPNKSMYARTRLVSQTYQ